MIFVVGKVCPLDSQPMGAGPGSIGLRQLEAEALCGEWDFGDDNAITENANFGAVFCMASSL